MPGEIRRNAEVGCWQEAMRTALYDGVKESDIGEIVRGVVAKAKKGDLKAAEFLFRWTIGQQPKVIQQVVVQQQPDAVIDLGPGPSDPSPEEIAQRTLQIRQSKDSTLRKALG